MSYVFMNIQILSHKAFGLISSYLLRSQVLGGVRCLLSLPILFIFTYTPAYPNKANYSEVLPMYLHTRRPVPSTDQAIPSCFYFRIS